jgi:predicted exporter
MVKKSPLDDPENAAHAWARYRQIMKILLAVTIATVLLAVAILYAFNGMVSVHFYIAVALGISFTMLLGGGLMGLVFLSNGTGHDESVDNRLPSSDEFWSPKDDN